MNKPNHRAEKAARIYRTLVLLYPKDYRDAFGAQMLRTFMDQYDDVSAQREKAGMGFWLAVVSDEVKGSVKEQTVSLRARCTLPKLLLISVVLLVASSFLWMPGYILSLKIPIILLLMIGLVAKRSQRVDAAAQNTAKHIWTRQGLRYGGVLSLFWVALNLASHLSVHDSSLSNVAKSLDLGILLLVMPILFTLVGFISGRSSGTMRDGTFAGLLAAGIGATIMVLSLVVIMTLFWDTVRSNAFQTAEMIRAWHASGDQSFSRYLWGDNLSGALAMTILSLIFGGLLGTLGSALGVSLPRKRTDTGQTVAASAGEPG